MNIFYFLLNFLNIVTSKFQGIFEALSNNLLSSNYDKIIAAENYMKAKLTYSMDQYFVFLFFFSVLFAFSIVVFMAYLKERKKPRY